MRDIGVEEEKIGYIFTQEKGQTGDYLCEEHAGVNLSLERGQTDKLLLHQCETLAPRLKQMYDFLSVG